MKYYILQTIYITATCICLGFSSVHLMAGSWSVEETGAFLEKIGLVHLKQKFNGEFFTFTFCRI